MMGLRMDLTRLVLIRKKKKNAKKYLVSHVSSYIGVLRVVRNTTYLKGSSILNINKTVESTETVIAGKFVSTMATLRMPNNYNRTRKNIQRKHVKAVKLHSKMYFLL